MRRAAPTAGISTCQIAASNGGAPCPRLSKITTNRFQPNTSGVNGLADIQGGGRNHTAAGRRCLLIITGKGERGEGILRQALPEAPNAGRILAIEQAQARHGGDGAIVFHARLARK